MQIALIGDTELTDGVAMSCRIIPVSTGSFDINSFATG
jgi:hypothetical protein